MVHLWCTLVYTLVYTLVHLRSGALAVAIFDTQNSVDNVDNTIVSQSVVVGQNCNIFDTQNSILKCCGWWELQSEKGETLTDGSRGLTST